MAAVLILMGEDEARRQLKSVGVQADVGATEVDGFQPGRCWSDISGRVPARPQVLLHTQPLRYRRFNHRNVAGSNLSRQFRRSTYNYEGI